MSLVNLPLVDWGNGAFIITIVFALVCLLLAGSVIIMIGSGKKKDKN